MTMDLAVQRHQYTLKYNLLDLLLTIYTNFCKQSVTNLISNICEGFELLNFACTYLEKEKYFEKIEIYK